MKKIHNFTINQNDKRVGTGVSFSIILCLRAFKTEISKFFIFSQKKLFGETFSKITKFPKNFLFSRKPGKIEMLPYTI